MKNSTIIRIVILGALAIFAIVGIQTYWFINTWDIKEKEQDERIKFALMNVAKEFERIGAQLPAYDLINRISSNYYVVNVNDVINANNLQFFLRREFEEFGLEADFEYGIYDCATNKMVYGNYISYSNDPDTNNLQKNDLPIYDKFTYYFGVRFPNQTSRILSTMGTTITFSIILLITIFFFLYSIFIILRQKQLSEMQKDFINNMTHEFKTPISTIKISADVFLKEEKIKSDKRLQRYAQIIRDQNQRLNRQVEKVLQLARIERDNFKLKEEVLELHPMLESIVQSTKLKVEDKGGELHFKPEAQEDIIKADPLHLNNLIHNLLDNALKYSKNTPVIHIQTKSVTGGLQVMIKDNGIGIPSEYHNKVFEKFFRVPTGNVHDVKGFGLGLYYIRNICKAQGWKINLESEAQKGTTFYITIPVYQEEKPKKRIFGLRRAAI